MSDLYSTNISDFPLWWPTLKALQDEGVYTVGDLLAHSDADLMGIKGFGKIKLQEVQRLIAADIIPRLHLAEEGVFSLSDTGQEPSANDLVWWDHKESGKVWGLPKYREPGIGWVKR